MVLIRGMYAYTTMHNAVRSERKLGELEKHKDKAYNTFKSGVKKIIRGSLRRIFEGF